MPIKVLLVDDNPMYRRSLKRNLELHGFEVREAEDSQSATEALVSEVPGVLITDLDMRTRTEGLELIQIVARNYPVLPIILISAVGTFDQGAMAKEYGATYVLSKAQVGKKGESLVDLLRKANDIHEYNQKVLVELGKIQEQWTRQPGDDLTPRIREILQDDKISSHAKGEAFDLLNEIQQPAVEQETREALQQVRAIQSPGIKIEEINIDKDIQRFEKLQPESLDSLKTAEFLFHYQEMVPGGYDFSRNIGFSYCFVVENEAKAKLRHKLPKFLKSTSTYDSVNKMYDQRMGNIDLFFQQQLMRLQQIKKLDFQVDKIKQVMEKMMLHKEHYKPDGLKAMGIMVLCFGRKYELMHSRGKMEINNPLGLKGLTDDDEILRLAHELIRLQHFRNPYIHPEITVREKVAIIREAALQCLDYVNRLEE